MAFVSGGYVEDGGQLHTVRLEGGQRRTLAEFDRAGSVTTWAPDGWIYFLSFLPRWASDGQSVTFRGSERALYSRRVDGTGDAELLYDEVPVVHGFWSPDGAWLVLRQAGSIDTGEGYRNILAMPADGDGHAKSLWSRSHRTTWSVLVRNFFEIIRERRGSN